MQGLAGKINRTTVNKEDWKQTLPVLFIYYT